MDAREKEQREPWWPKVQAFWGDYGIWLSLVWAFGLIMAASLWTSSRGLWGEASVYQRALLVLLPVVIATVPTSIFTWWLISERRKR